MSDNAKLIHPTDTISIGDIFEIDIEHYADAYIPDQELSNRTINCLMRARITTVKDLLSCSPKFLMGVNYFGLTSLRDVERFAKNLKCRYESVDDYRDQILNSDFSFCSQARLSPDATATVDILLQMHCRDSEEYSKLSREASTVQELLEKIFEHAKAQQREMAVLEDIEKIPNLRLQMPLKSFLNIGEPNRNNRDAIVNIVGNNDATVAEFCQMVLKNNQYADITDPFIKRLSYSLPNDIAETMKICCHDERAERIMHLRMEGRTLEEIASEYGVTRERVRQIERSVIDKFRASVCELKIVDKLSIETGKKTGFTREDIMAIENGSELFYRCLDLLLNICRKDNQSIINARNKKGI